MKNKIIFLLILVVLVLVSFILVTKKDVLVKKEILDEESVVTRVVENSTESVVTISSGDKDIGTGFIISGDGLIVTNKHVVADIGAQYKVIIGKDTVAEVVSVYRDPVNDLAIAKVEKTGLKSVNLGDSDKIKVGQTVIAIGTALGEFRSTVTKGVVSGLGRGITAGSFMMGSERLDGVIQTDAAINPGNSGGPLFNSNGEVIGVNVAVNQVAQNIGFALPINLVKESIENFKSTGQFDRPYLGVAYKMVKNGAQVENVILGSPAQKAGILIGDVVVEVDGKKLIVEKNTVLSTYINRQKIGGSVMLKILRNNQEIGIQVILEKRVQ
ncbi:MAG: trypsin-like peptidase domain-containing protein [Candidatus Shapirobacteria bacterium]